MNNENGFDFESRRSIFNEIMEAIKDDGVEMIGIWGLRGIGKTTLVKRVAKYAKDEGLFEVVAMAVVSQNPSFKSIQGQIADKIGLKLTSESEKERARQLYLELLSRKNILVILDDIWVSIGLNVIGIPSRTLDKSCKIILTSRKRGVCKEMRTGKNFKIDLLSANEALHLFLQMSGVDNQFSEKRRLAEKLSEECGRLPISIVIVARGLLNKEQLYWTDMLNRLRKSDPDRKVHTTIELSYDNLDCEEEKMFFLLCALFPEDYEIPVPVLFEYGLGLNLFERVDNMDEAMVRAQNLASRLKSQCLLLDEGNENFVKMHDVIRDVALVIASRGKHAFLVRSVVQRKEWRGKTAISLWSEDVKKLPYALECPQLQILMLNCSHPDLQICDNFFVGMKNLVVLDISHMDFVRLPQSFAALENLQTLRFSTCYLGDISAIGKLQNLISLSFYDSYIEELPKEVGELSNLRLLDLSSCESLEVITPGVIQNLSQLEVLRVGSNVRWCDGKEVCRLENASLLELIHLSRLIILEICIPDASMLPDDVLFENLMKFKVSIGKGNFVRMNIFSSNSQILKLRSLSENELLKAGIKMLMKKAQHMELKGISGISVALPSQLWQFDAKFVALGNLTIMNVESCDKLEYVFEHSSPKSLSKLKELEVGKCRNLKAICLSEGQEDDIVFLQLSHLKLSELENLTSFGSKFTSESTLFDEQVIFRALKTLHIDNLEKLKKIWHIHTPVESFIQLKVLKLTRCPELLVVFPPQATSGLRNLEEICIENCQKLETFFQLDDASLTVADEMVLFPRLLTLKLVNLPKFTTFLSTTSHNLSQATVIFSATKIMTPCRLHKLESIIYQQLLTFFPKMKKLELEGIGRLSSNADPLHIIKGLEALEELRIKDNKGKTLAQGFATFPKLWTLQLGFIHEPIESCDTLNRCGGFQNLTSLKFFSCNGVKSLLRPSIFTCLVQLYELFVSECETIESIVEETSGEQNLDKAIEFSKLSTLKLDNLPRLASFYNGECALKFPCLVDLTVEGCDRLLKLFPSNMLLGLQNLKELYVRSCRSLEHVFAVEDHPPLLSNLQELELCDLPVLKQLWWNMSPRESFGLPSLQHLMIDNCLTLEFVFDPSVANRLESLGSLVVENCSSIVEIVAEKPGKKIEFPVLHNLFLANLPCFKVNQSVAFSKVESVFVDRCFNSKKRDFENFRHESK